MMNKKVNKYYRITLAELTRRYPEATPEELNRLVYPLSEEAIAELREWAEDLRRSVCDGE